MRQQTLAERAWERLVSLMVQQGWNLARGSARHFDAPGPGGLVFQVHPGMDSIDGGVVMIPALAIANAEVDRLVGAFKDLPDSSAAMYGSDLSDVLSQRGLRVSPYERWFIAAGEAIEPVLTLLCSDVNEYGMPFFHRFGGLEDVIAQLEAKPRGKSANEILAMACAVIGRRDEALSVLAQYEDAAARQPPVIAAQSRAFARAFRDHFSW
jgi:hypothetical protein